MTAFQGWLLGIISTGVGVFIGAYLKQKGKNLATHEDIEKLVDQVKATTEATKAIETRLEGALWDRQRQWELKKEALLEGGRAMSDFLAAVTKMQAAFSVTHENENLQATLIQHQNKAMDFYNDAVRTFERALLIVSVVSSKSTQTCFVAMEKILKNISVKIAEGDTESFKKIMPMVRVAATAITNSIRSELGMTLEDSPPTSLSSGSSEAPSPAPPNRE